MCHTNNVFFMATCNKCIYNAERKKIKLKNIFLDLHFNSKTQHYDIDAEHIKHCSYFNICGCFSDLQ